MSYLDIPRIHFSGSFCSNPSTQNNNKASFAPGASGVPAWNPMGMHWFYLQDCTVKTAIGPDGNPAPADAVVGGAVDTTNDPGYGRMVDIDPDYQQASQIWGAQFKVSLKGGGGEFKGKLQTATLRDLWLGRAPGGFSQGFSGVYQSAFKEPTFQSVSSSPILTALSKATGIAIKFVVYAYDSTQGTPKFTFGRIVGTIGPFGPADGDETSGMDLGVHFLQARRMEDAGSRAFGKAPFKLNPGKKKVTIDLGNCIPEVSPAGARRNFGTMEAVILLPSAKPEVLGTLDYSQAHYEQTAGIEDIKITDKQVSLLKKNQLGLRVSSPSTSLVMNERPMGLYIDATEIAFRLNSGDSQSVTLVATEFGVATSGRKLDLKLISGTPPAGISFPSSVTAGTGFSITAADPGNPRGAVDGQLYQVGYYSGGPAASFLEGTLIIKVYDPFRPKSFDVPTIMPILAQYAQVYPFMKARMDIGDLKVVKANAAAILKSINWDEEDPRYMPVTRDLSSEKKLALRTFLLLLQMMP
jgi:hypothetical protein